MMNSFTQDYWSNIFVIGFSILLILSFTLPIMKIFYDYLNTKYQGFIDYHNEKDDLGYYFFAFFLVAFLIVFSFLALL